MSLQGNLSDLPLIDLVQVLTLQNKTGILSVNRDFSQAQVCFTKAHVYSAFVHHIGSRGKITVYQGEEALYDLLSWPDGQFVFELSNSLPSHQNVEVTWNYIILEHCRRQDEKNQLMTDACPHLVPNPPGQAEISLSLEDWQILLQVDGQHRITEIAEKLRQAPQMVAEKIQKLVKLGLVELAHEPNPASTSRFKPSVPALQVVPAPTDMTAYYVPPVPTGYQPHMQPAFAGGPQWAAPAALPPVAAEREVAYHAPKVQRGLMAGIIAKIRGL